MMPLHTERLIIRNWEERDRDVFHQLNFDESIMEFFDFRLSRSQADALFDEIQHYISETGFGFASVELKQTGCCVGQCGLAEVEMEPVFAQGTIEIGWRLVPPCWGHGYATEAAQALIDEGFANRGLDEIISFASAANRRSTLVMERIGMRRDLAGDFVHPEVSASYPHLQHFVLYRMARNQWRKSARQNDSS